MNHSATPEEMQTPSSKRSPKVESDQSITSKRSENQTAALNASANVSTPSTATSKSSSGVRKPTVKRRKVSPSPSSTSQLVLNLLSSSPSPQSSRNTTRVLFPNAQSRSKCSDPVPFESIVTSSDESEPKPGPSAAQTITDPSRAQMSNIKTPSDKPLRAVRPTSEPRTASAPTPLTGGSISIPSSDTKVKSAQDIDGDIEQQIRQPKRLSKRGKELGYIYVLPAEVDGKRLVKIGHTTEASVNTRIRGITTGRCEGTIRILSQGNASPEHTQVPIFYEQVEKLAHRELANFRHDFVCLCGKRHEELFVVDEAVGHMVVERWARLCALRRPFDDRRDCAELKDEWEFHLDQFRERNHGRVLPGEQPQQQHERNDDHVGRHRRWESFLASKRTDWYLHRACVSWGKVWSHRWQIWSSVLALLLVLSTLSRWSLALFIVNTGGVILEESMRSWVRELAVLLSDVAVHYWRYLRPVSGKPALAAS